MHRGCRDNPPAHCQTRIIERHGANEQTAATVMVEGEKAPAREYWSRKDAENFGENARRLTSANTRKHHDKITFVLLLK